MFSLYLYMCITTVSEPPPQYYGGEDGKQQGYPQTAAHTQPQPQAYGPSQGNGQPQAYDQPGQGRGQFSNVVRSIPYIPFKDKTQLKQFIRISVAYSSKDTSPVFNLKHKSTSIQRI